MLFLGLFVLWGFFIALIYVLADKEQKLSFKEKYYLNIPADYTPAEMGCLMNYGKTSVTDITASVVDLCRKGYLHINRIILDDIKLLVSRQQDFVISKTNQYEHDKYVLKPHELYLIEWLIDKIGDGRQVSASQIRNATRRKEGVAAFGVHYSTWCHTVFMVSKTNNFFKTRKPGIILGFLVCALYIIAPICLTISSHSYHYLFLIVLGVITMLYALQAMTRTASGQEDYELWMAFKRFLKEPTNERIDKETMENIERFETYIAYSISLGAFASFLPSLKVLFRGRDFGRDSLQLLRARTVEDIEGFVTTFERVMQVCMQAQEKV